MKTNTIILEANTRTELENKIVSHISNGYKPTTEVFSNDEGKFLITLIKKNHGDN